MKLKTVGSRKSNAIPTCRMRNLHPKSIDPHDVYVMNYIFSKKCKNSTLTSFKSKSITLSNSLHTREIINCLNYLLDLTRCSGENFLCQPHNQSTNSAYFLNESVTFLFFSWRHHFRSPVICICILRVRENVGVEDFEAAEEATAARQVNNETNCCRPISMPPRASTVMQIHRKRGSKKQRKRWQESRCSGQFLFQPHRATCVAS